MNDSLHDELEQLLAELQEGDASRQQRTLEAILRERSQTLASPPREANAETPTYHVLSFQLGREMYALDVLSVRGVRPLPRVTRVPRVPPFYKGVVNVRGQIVSVLDLRLFFGMDIQENALPKEMVLVEANQITLALLADTILEVLHIPHEAVEPVETRYAYGVTMGRLVVLNIDALFRDERLLVGVGG